MKRPVYWSRSTFLAWCAEWRRYPLIAVGGALSGLLLRLLIFKLEALNHPRGSVLDPAPRPVHDYYALGGILAILFLVWLLGTFEDPRKRLAVFILSFFAAIFLCNIFAGVCAWLAPA